MTIENELLNRLLDKYERSGHCLPGRVSNRRISVSLNEAEFPYYQQNRRDRVEEVNAAVSRMKSEALVDFRYQKGYEGWLIEKVFLNLDKVPEAYQAVGRKPISQKAGELLDVLENACKKSGRGWVRMFIQEEKERLRQTYKASRMLPDDPALARNLFTVLQASEKGSQLMRVLSVQCFHDSKYLERNLISFLLSIARHYEPDIVAYSRQGDEKLTDNEVLTQIGILRYPEIFEFCGNINLTVMGIPVSAAPFLHGFCLQSETLADMRDMDLGEIRRVYFVENRTNYRALVLRGVPKNVLLVHHGGFYSPAHAVLFQKIVKAAEKGTEFYFWGDLDFGGFQMLERLRRNIVPHLRPYRMDSAQLYHYRKSGQRRSAEYLQKLKQFKAGTDNPDIQGGMEAILETGVTVEQESMLDADIVL